jgi:Domain of unknown function (DUF4397)
MKRLRGIAATALAGLSLLAGPGSASGAGRTATVSVLHGVPGVKVDVCVDKAEVSSGFTYGSSFSAKLPAGQHNVSVRAAKAGQCTGDIIRYAKVDLTAGRNYSLVAGLTAKGAPRLYAFRNSIRDVRTGYARAQVRHVAGAPSVDVRVNGARAIRGFIPGEQATVALPKGDYTVRVVPKGTRTTVIGPRTFSLEAGTAYQLYAVGSADAGYRFAVLAQDA